MRYDLNLLKAFDALYMCGNVSRAAERIGVSQPAMSALLRRLRDLFNDPLFVRDRHGISPTPKASEIHPGIQQALNSIDQIVLQQQEFDPASEERNYQIAANDYFEFIVLPKLMKQIRKRAPGIRLHLMPLSQNIKESGIMSGRTELAFGRISTPPDNLILRTAMTEGLSCLINLGHSSVAINSKKLSLRQFETNAHVIVKPSEKLRTGIFQILEEKEVNREAICSVTHFHAVPGLIEKTDYIATLPRRVCAAFSHKKGLRMIEPPKELGTFPFHLAWHQRYQKDPAHMWLRNEILTCCNNLDAAKEVN